MFKKTFFIASFLLFNFNVKIAKSCSLSPQIPFYARLWEFPIAVQGQVIAIAPIENENYHEVIVKVSKVWNSIPDSNLGLYKRYVFKVHSNNINPPEPAYCTSIVSYEVIEKYSYYVFSIRESNTTLPIGSKIIQVDSAKDFRWFSLFLSSFNGQFNPKYIKQAVDIYTDLGHLKNPVFFGSNLTHTIFTENKK